MLLSRFWYLLLALALGGAVFTLFVAAQMYNRSGDTAMKDALAADSSAVDWFLKDDAHRRSAELIRIVLTPEIRAGLAKASGEDKLSKDNREKTKAALKKLSEQIDTKFDALWAVDAGGRVIAAVGVEHTDEWELGGYSVVADALHGWIRDDAWVWRGVIYRVTARPVENELNSEPVGAVVGAKIVNDTFAEVISKRTGASVAFYAGGSRVAAGTPGRADDMDKSNLDLIVQDLKDAEADKNYQEKGRTEARVLAQHVGVVYARMPGEAWDLGAGYAVARLAVSVSGPLDFLSKLDNADKSAVPTPLIVGGVVAIAFLGLLFSFLEHTRPLSTFKSEVARIAQGQIDVLQPSRFRGVYKKIAADLNDGIEKVAAKGGAPRRAADLEQVIGPLPAQPQMSAFALPGSGAVPDDRPSDPRPNIPKAPPPSAGQKAPAPRLRQAPPSASGPASSPGGPPSAEPLSLDAEALDGPTIADPSPPLGAAPPRKPPPPPRASAPRADAPPQENSSPGGDEAFDEIADWRRVYEEFLNVKRQCGEPVQSLTFEKFKGTLQRNKDALVARHNCSRVKFTVYVKDGKAALKASPVK